MARRPTHHEEHVNHEAWAIPYGDLVTLLLAFFVVMYAISSVNEGKFRVLADAMSSAFGGPPRTVSPIQLGHTQLRGSSFDRPSMQTPDAKSGPAAASPIHAPRVRQMLDLPTFGRQQRRAEKPAPAGPGAGAGGAKAGSGAGAAANAGAQTGAGTAAGDAESAGSRTTQLHALGQRIQDALSELVRQKLVTVRRGPAFLEVEIQSDILFASGVAQPSPLAVQTVRRLAAVLAAEGNAVRVEGYTDDRPIHTAQFPSNWELSAARAGSVVHELVGAGVDAGRLAVVGYGEHQPIADNATAEGRNTNRRVMLVILATPQGPDAEPERAAAATAITRSSSVRPAGSARPRAAATGAGALATAGVPARAGMLPAAAARTVDTPAAIAAPTAAIGGARSGNPAAARAGAG